MKKDKMSIENKKRDLILLKTLLNDKDSSLESKIKSKVLSFTKNLDHYFKMVNDTKNKINQLKKNLN